MVSHTPRDLPLNIRERPRPSAGMSVKAFMFRSFRSNRHTLCRQFGALLTWVAFACGPPVARAADSLSIGNDLLTVRVSPEAGTFEVARHVGDAPRSCVRAD